VRVLLSEGKGLEIDCRTATAAPGHLRGCATPALRHLQRRAREGRPQTRQPKRKPAAVLPMYVPPPKPASAHAVGRYALQFNWQDGHTAGIYSWEYCAASASAASAPSPRKGPPDAELNSADHGIARHHT